MRIDSTGMKLEDSYINIKATQIDLTTSTFNVPVDFFTVDGANGVQFTVDGNNGATQAKGDLTVGGSTIPSMRTLTVASSDDSVLTVLSAADTTKDSTLRLTDAAGANAFDIMKDDTVLKIQAANAAGIIEINPGAGSGVLRVNADKFTVSGASGDTTMRGDVTIGGSSVTGTKSVTVESNDEHVTLALQAGNGKEPKITFGDGLKSFTMKQLNSALSLSADSTDGTIQINPGSSSGSLTIGPTSGNNVVIDTATANTAIDGTLTVVGKSTLSQLDIETALATGSSNVRIDKATGILTSAPSRLTPYTTNGGGALDANAASSSPNVDTLILQNTRVTSSSVVMATVVGQCNDNTMVTVRTTVCTTGEVTFTTVNLGTQACDIDSSERYEIAFVVLN
jgi:hypothetical protein